MISREKKSNLSNLKNANYVGYINYLSQLNLDKENERNVLRSALQMDGLILRDLNLDFKSIDQGLALTSVGSAGMALQYLPGFQNDIHVVRLAVAQDARAFIFASDAIKACESIVDEITKVNGNLLCFASVNCKDSKVLVINAVTQYGCALKYVSKRLCNDYDVTMAAVKSSGLALEFASINIQDNEAIVTEAIKNNPNAIKYASLRLKSRVETVKLAISLGFTSFEHLRVPNIDKKPMISSLQASLFISPKGIVPIIWKLIFNGRNFFNEECHFNAAENVSEFLSIQDVCRLTHLRLNHDHKVLYNTFYASKGFFYSSVDDFPAYLKGFCNVKVLSESSLSSLSIESLQDDEGKVGIESDLEQVQLILKKRSSEDIYLVDDDSDNLSPVSLADLDLFSVDPSSDEAVSALIVPNTLNMPIPVKETCGKCAIS